MRTSTARSHTRTRAMPEIHHCTAQISPDQICEGHYTLENGVLTMVYANGEPVELPTGPVTHAMRPDDDALCVAKVLTKEVRSKLRGEIVPGFSRFIPVTEVVV